ncbi:MAG: hypothetical protein LBL69_04420, partial [Zoogloeaceae bacterium]|nr:hypothetical protein [Zoogloeaceae bacterium]
MKIAESQMVMAASHREENERQTRESMRTSGAVPDALKDSVVALRKDTLSALKEATEEAAKVDLSPAGRTAAAQEADSAQGVSLDPKLDMLRMAVELLTGRKIELGKVLDFAQRTGGQQGAVGSFGLSYEYEETIQQSEQTSFAASGTVKTADGREIGFSVSLSMSWEYRSESRFSLSLGGGAQKL